jgi:hypothetical protein
MGEGGSQGERGSKIKKTINRKIRMGFAVVFQGGGIELWHWWWGGGLRGIGLTGMRCIRWGEDMRTMMGDKATMTGNNNNQQTTIK